MQNNVNIDIRQAIGYLLYLFQAIKWIALEQIDEDDILRKISIPIRKFPTGPSCSVPTPNVPNPTGRSS